jgi:choline-sulfatase
LRVLFIDIDTLRPDHMGCYGYARNTTPNLDGVARDGVIMEQM